jgi:hypothetical protein
LLLTQKIYGSVSTNIKDLLLQYIGSPVHDPSDLFAMTGFKTATQTVIIYVPGIKFAFQDYDNTQRILTSIKTLAETAQRTYRRFVSITSKWIFVTFDKGIPMCRLTTQEERKTRMNASIQFNIQSRVYPGKVYKILLFSTGSIKISGVKECFMLSDIRDAVYSILDVCHAVIQNIVPFGVPSVSIAMGNYSAQFQLASTQRIDLMKIQKIYKRDPLVLRKACEQFELQCVGFEVSVARIAGFFKFQIPRLQATVRRENVHSTSQRRAIISISIQVTARGNIMIQGSTGDFFVTKRIIERFVQFASSYLSGFTV